MIWQRFRGMIHPGMAESLEGARAVRNRKSIWMVEYLRARRLSVDFGRPQAMRDAEKKMLSFYRRKHLKETSE